MIESYSMLAMLRDFVTKINELRIEYMVTGSFAMSAYGEIRTTRDIDIVIELSAEKAHDFALIFQDDYYVDENSIRRALENQSMFNVVSTFHGAKIDCIVRKSSEFEKQKFGNRRRARIDQFEFWTITKEDLIISKLEWARESQSEMQIRDIANLVSNEYDFEYVNKWIHRLGLSDIWASVEQWKTQHLK